MNKNDLTTGSIPGNLIRLTLPMMLGIMSMVAFNLIDTYFVGKLGKTELAALSFTFPIIMIVFSIVQGLGMGATALIAKSIGKGDQRKAARETTDSIALTLLLTGVFVIIGSLSIDSVLSLLGADGETAALSKEYMQIWFFALFFVSVPFVGNSAIRATGDAKTPTYIMLFAVCVNAILDPILIFGYSGFPALGLKGAAIATAISRGLTMVLSLYILIRRDKLITFEIPSLKVLTGCWRSILYIALPSGLGRLVVPISTGVITALLAGYGEFAVAAYGVGSRIEFLANSLIFALAGSIGPFVGQNLGKGRIDRIQECLRISSGFALVWGLIAWGLLALFSRPLALIFNSQAEVIETVQLFLWIVPAGFGLQGILSIINSNLNTINKPLQASSVIIIQMLVLGLPAIFLGRELGGVKGIFMGIAATYAIGGLLSLLVNRVVMNRFIKESAPAK